MLSISDLEMRFGAQILFSKVSVQFFEGNCYGLVGANGSGKSTFLKILTGELTPEKGQLSIASRYKMASLKQDHFRYEERTLLETVLEGKPELALALQLQDEILDREHPSDSDCERLVALQEIIAAHDGYSAESEAATLLAGLGLPHAKHKQAMKTLSGGFKLRVLLAQLLFSMPDVLLLDEPTNHLDILSIQWLEEYLRSYRGTVIVISHDRTFLNNCCSHMADLDHGTLRIYPGNYDAFVEAKLLAAEQMEANIEGSERKRAHLQSFVDRFGAKATKAAQANARKKAIEKLDAEMSDKSLEPTSRIRPSLSWEPERASGAIACKVKGISKSYGQLEVLRDVSFQVERAEKIAIIGPNGVGKSTLLQILTDHIAPDSGSYEWGHAVRYAYFPQDHAQAVHGNGTVLEWLTEQASLACGKSFEEGTLRGILGRVLFSGDDVKKKLSSLSGGEKARLLMGKMMLMKPNVLIFDEPTNHLDMEAIEALIDALEAYEGTLLFVSHNRHFVESLAQRVIEVTLQHVENFLGTYADFCEKRSRDHLAIQKAAKAAPVKAAPVAPRPNNKRQLEKLEAQIATTEAESAKLSAQFADPSFYTKTPLPKQQTLAAEKDELDKKLLKLMSEWESLQE